MYPLPGVMQPRGSFRNRSRVPLLRLIHVSLGRNPRSVSTSQTAFSRGFVSHSPDVSFAKQLQSVGHFLGANIALLPGGGCERDSQREDFPPKQPSVPDHLNG